MFKCYFCGGKSARPELVSEVFILEQGRTALLECIPAQVCVHCGEATFSRETAEWIRRLLNDVGRLGDAGHLAGDPPLQAFALS